MLSWMHFISQKFACILLVFILCTATTSDAITESRDDRIKNKVLDETQFSNPKSFDYNFDDDLKKPADKNDVYDELVPYLPTFVLHKNGKNIGRTSVPIITRKMPAWSTPPPKQKYVKPYETFSTKLPVAFQSRSGSKGLTAPSQSRFSQRFQQQQQHTQMSIRTASIALPPASLTRSITTRKSSATTKKVQTSSAKPRTLPSTHQQKQQRPTYFRTTPRSLTRTVKATYGAPNRTLIKSDSKQTSVRSIATAVRSN